MRPQYAQARTPSFLLARGRPVLLPAYPCPSRPGPTQPQGAPSPPPTSGFCPGGCGFSPTSPSLPVRWSSRSTLMVPILTTDHLSVFTPVTCLGTRHLKPQLLRSVAFPGILGGIVRFYPFSFWKVLVLDSGDSVFLLSLGSSSLVVSEFVFFFNVVMRTHCKLKLYCSTYLKCYSFFSVLYVFFASESRFPLGFSTFSPRFSILIICPGISRPTTLVSYSVLCRS